MSVVLRSVRRNYCDPALAPSCPEAPSCSAPRDQFVLHQLWPREAGFAGKDSRDEFHCWCLGRERLPVRSALAPTPNPAAADPTPGQCGTTPQSDFPQPHFLQLPGGATPRLPTTSKQIAPDTSVARTAKP